MDKEQLMKLGTERESLKTQLKVLNHDLKMNEYCDDFHAFKYNDEKIRDEIGAISRRLGEIGEEENKLFEE